MADFEPKPARRVPCPFWVLVTVGVTQVVLAIGQSILLLTEFGYKSNIKYVIIAIMLTLCTVIPLTSKWLNRKPRR